MSRIHVAVTLALLLVAGSFALARQDASPIPAINAVLDDFHDAASKADGDRYFGHLASNAVFIGTDATERWTRDAFMAFAKPYFDRGTGWTYTPRQRHITLTGAGDVAWFDELLDSAKYGECRGTGVLVRTEDGPWRIAQYSLSFPIPNDVAKDVTTRIRAHHEKTPAEPTRVYVVRHAEKRNVHSRDPLLTEEGEQRAAALSTALRSVDLKAVYASQFKRTQHTGQPAADAHGVPLEIMDARDSDALAKRILADHRGQAVLVCGHSNTVPAVIRAFGVDFGVLLGESDYDNLFVVTINADGTRWVERLHY